MELIRKVAHAAVTDAHWYEPYPRGMDPIPTLTFGANRDGDHTIRKWVSTDRLLEALSPKKRVSAPDLAQWRNAMAKRGKVPPDNFLAMLLSDLDMAANWTSLEDEWRCPVCQRSKAETVYVGGKGKMKFYASRTSGKGQWSAAPIVCNHCKSTLMSLKLEVAALVGATETFDSYRFVTPGELKNVIVARAHSAHEIRTDTAAALISTIVARFPR
jgi:hypothetical protein